MIKPIHILLFILSISIMLTGIMFGYNYTNIKITDNLTLNFPSAKTFFKFSETEHTDISEIINIKTESVTDSTITSDSTIVKNNSKEIKKKKIQELEYTTKGRTLLFNFFNNIKKSRKVSHIIHYGDSQIEGDRITAYFRNKLQKRYGGTGVGMVSADKLVKSFSINQEIEGEWHRYNIFGRRDSTVNHRRYGAMGTFSRFAPTNAASNSNIYESSITFSRSNIAYQKDRYFNNLRIFYGNAKEPVLAEIYINGKLEHFAKLTKGKSVKEKRWYFKNNPKTLKIKFTGSDSPDIYGISLEGNKGIVVDNVPMRGASGTNFTSIDYSNLKSMIDKLNVKMIIFEFGGNIVPYIESKKGLKNYGRAFSHQLKRFKNINPKIPIIVIGPADMSTKKDGNFVTYPYLELLIDEMKARTLEHDYIFWDMYLAMGGENSMPEWVKNNPPLAAKDYIHFSTKGAKIIAEKFYEAIIKIQDEYDYIIENKIEYNL